MQAFIVNITKKAAEQILEKYFQGKYILILPFLQLVQVQNSMVSPPLPFHFCNNPARQEKTMDDPWSPNKFCGFVKI